jgi:hypothetical protein
VIRFKIDPARPIGEHVYFGCIRKVLNGVAPKVIPIRLFASREGVIKVRVLLEGDTPFVFETTEIPENFFQIRIFTEDLWR